MPWFSAITTSSNKLNRCSPWDRTFWFVELILCESAYTIIVKFELSNECISLLLITTSKLYWARPWTFALLS